MNTMRHIGVLALGLALCVNLAAQTGPWSGGAFKGRIALSHDGNYNDEDDWGAFPVIIAMLDAFGVKDKVVHIDYNNITNYNDARFESEMTTSVLGAAEKYGIPSPVLKNCLTDLDGAVRSITAAVNASSAENPLYYLLAGPMDVPWRGIQAADPSKRQFVYCISHSVWNDGYGRKRPVEGRTKRDVIDLGVKWIQVRSGDLMSASTRTQSTLQQWAMINWMRDSRDERLRWVWSRIRAVDRVDVSDATITYSLLTGDEAGDLRKLEALLNRKRKPDPIGLRSMIRLEAENFESLEHTTTVLVGKSASQALAVSVLGAPKGAIRTRLHEIYANPPSWYDVDIQYRGAKSGGAMYQLVVNGVAQGEAWRAEDKDNSWKTQTVRKVALATGDEIGVRITADGGDRGELDFVQLNYREPNRTAASASPAALTFATIEPAWRALPLIEDGKVADCWKHIGWGGFSVDEGALKTECDARGLGLLVYEKERLGNCQIRVVYKTKEAKSNSGVYVRMSDGILDQVNKPGAAFDRDAKNKISKDSMARMMESAEREEGAWYAVHHGFEVQIMGVSDKMHRTGAIYSLAPSSTESKAAPGEWTTMTITLSGSKIFVELDGRRVTAFDSGTLTASRERKWTEPKLDTKRPEVGYIGLQNHDPGDIVWFREVSIRSLPNANRK